MRIAVIGSGISGLTASYLLAAHAEVTLFESEKEIGGHAHTVDVPFGDTSYPVDTGFMVFNPVHYPYFSALLRVLKVDSVDTVMSFSVSIPGEVEYSSNYSGLFGDKRQLMRPAYWRLLKEILRFNRTAKQFLASTESDRSLKLGEFAQKHAFSRELVEWYRFPMVGSIWSAASKDLSAYPAYETFRFLNNHQLLNVFDKPVWQTVKGGSRTYVRALKTVLENDGVSIRTSSPVTSVARDESGVTVTTAQGTEPFDRVIIAAHADAALKLLSDPSPDERRALSGFTYSYNDVVLHSDENFMPRAKGAWASWNFHSAHQMESMISLTYNMNMLQHIPEECPVFVTLNPRTPVRADRIHGRFSYAHPIFNTAARDAQDEITALQGRNKTYYAGAHLGFGFHEDGAQSAVRVIESLGFPIRLIP